MNSIIKDILPGRSEALRALERKIVETFTLWGYQEVIPPLFERHDDYSRAAGRTEGLYRFLDHRTGEVMVFRSDFTPQVVRILAQWYGNVKDTLRLHYSGQVLRHSGSELAFYQTGCEIFSRSAYLATYEPVLLCGEVMKAVGVSAATVSINNSEILSTLIGDGEVPIENLKEALARKNEQEVKELLGHAVSRKTRELVIVLCELYGDVSEVRKRARPLLESSAGVHMREILRVAHLLSTSGVFHNVFIDLADFRYMAYHSGLVFSVYTEGVHAPVASGGRYDRLLRRWGLNYKAGGFGVNMSLLMKVANGQTGENVEVLTFHGIKDLITKLKQAAKLRKKKRIVRLEPASSFRKPSRSS